MARILVVDGDERYRRACARALEGEGHDTLTAETGSEALRLAAQDPVDVVITEVRLAGMDGLDLMTRLLARQRNVIVILNSTSSAYQHSFMSWSASDFCTKSEDCRELSVKVRRLLDARESNPIGAWRVSSPTRETRRHGRAG